MTPNQVELLRKIESFEIDGGECDLPFAARLSREHGWPRSYADRVVREYKRFVFLAMCSSVPRCPSEDVDAAWHLHLTYTRNYWEQFCGKVLGRPFHHEPTRGGRDEAAKHITMYDATLEAYREVFGDMPPADIWPQSDQRFGDDARLRWVNTARNWIIPKRPVKRAIQLTAAFVVAAMVLPGCDGGLNPFALRGTEFFYFLIPAMIAAVLIGRVLRAAWQRQVPLPVDDDVNVTWEQAAYLAGGYARLTSSSIARLAEDQIVRIEGNRLENGTVIPKNRSTVENAIIGQLPLMKTEMKSVQEIVAASFRDEAARLEEAGLILSRPQRLFANVVSLVPLAIVVLLFGVPRLVMGLSSNKPVGFLVVALVIGSIFGALVCLAGKRHNSQRGKYVLNNLRKQYVDHKSDAGLAVALFGTTVLAGTVLAYVNDWYPRSRTTNSGCGSGCSSGGGGGGGGCGSGCGGRWRLRRPTSEDRAAW